MKAEISVLREEAPLLLALCVCIQEGAHGKETATHKVITVSWVFV